MSKASEQVKEFHKAFSVEDAEKPTIPSLDRRIMRARLIVEEVFEFLEASGLSLKMLSTLSSKNATFYIVPMVSGLNYVTPNIVEAADALADIKYVVEGAALTWGIPLDEVFDEVHRSNMSKVPEDGVIIKREDGKVLKPPTYSPPNIHPILAPSEG